MYHNLTGIGEGSILSPGIGKIKLHFFVILFSSYALPRLLFEHKAETWQIGVLSDV
jgi:hypothetical protein